MHPNDCDILLKPVVTEKGIFSSGGQQYIFEVSMRADKVRVKKVIEALFDVKVKYVNILRRKGKVKRFKGFPGCQKDRKRAFVCLEQGHVLNLSGA